MDRPPGCTRRSSFLSIAAGTFLIFLAAGSVRTVAATAAALMELVDPEISRSVVARLPYPLAYHDHAAHIVTDAFCLQASGLNGRWSAASYLDWLIAGPWKAEPGWSGAGGSAPPREQCLAGCTERFVSTRYRQFSKVHSACLLEAGPQSAHRKTAAAVSWAAEHKVAGTPTVYAGHPSIGFRMLGDSDNLVDFMALLRRTLAEARARIRLTAKAH